MKNLLTAILLFASINVFSQTQFGVKGGLTLGKIIGETKADYEPAGGYTLGVLLNTQLKGHASFQIELNYTKKVYGEDRSFIDEHQNPQGSATVNHRNTYLEVPLLIKYSKKEGDLKPYFVLGATVSYLLDSKYNLSSGLIASSSSNIYAKSELFKKGDAGATFGVGTDIKAGPVVIILEARYNQGFISMYKDSLPSYYSDAKVFNSYLTLTTGIKF